MKKFLLFMLAAVLFGACQTGSNSGTEPSGQPRSSGSPSSPSAANSFAVGDTVLYHSNTGQRFYEAKITNLEGTRVKLSRDNETVESNISDLYRVPKPGDKPTVKAGDIVAARFGQTAVWAGAEVVTARDNAVTVKWLSTGKNDDVLPENVLPLSATAAAKVKESFNK